MIKNYHWKKYFILLAIVIPIAIVAIFTLPYEKRNYALVILPLIFWLLYYSWIAFEKRKKDT
ncbi:hypothetical protein PGLA_00930 [Paenibacillus glacialis]|uniref:Uncharacterized protein n=1 Tax=Paenibacillus glacialis TaxID=494026 RepID=A0A168NPA5_9BACL|nr:hypothetical protein PGLA_00930 [Paenibacillus glacialis]